MTEAETALSIIGRCVTLEQIVRFESLLERALSENGINGRDTDSVCPVKHHFAPGMYAREMTIPKGTIIVGKMHRKDHLSLVVKGRIAVASEFGSKEFASGETFVSKAGVKRIGYALEDTIWTTFHATDKTDLAEIEAETIVPEHEVLERIKPLEVA